MKTILIGLVLTFGISVPVFADDDYEKMLAAINIVAIIKPTLPQTVEQDMVWTDITVITNGIQAHYVMSNAGLDSFSAEEKRNLYIEIKNQTLRETCQSGMMQPLFDQGLSMDNIFKDDKGEVFATLLMSNEVCKSLK